MKAHYGSPVLWLRFYRAIRVTVFTRSSQAMENKTVTSKKSKTQKRVLPAYVPSAGLHFSFNGSSLVKIKSKDTVPRDKKFWVVSIFCNKHETTLLVRPNGKIVTTQKDEQWLDAAKWELHSDHNDIVVCIKDLR